MSWVVAAALFALGTAYLIDVAGPGFQLSPHHLVPGGIFPWILIMSGIVSSVWQSTEALYCSLRPGHPTRRGNPDPYDQPQHALWAVGTGAHGVLYILVLAQYLGALPQAAVYVVVPLCTAIYATCLQLVYFPPKLLRVWVRA
jgi:hypothetical protein